VREAIQNLRKDR